MILELVLLEIIALITSGLISTINISLQMMKLANRKGYVIDFIFSSTTCVGCIAALLMGIEVLCKVYI